MIISPPLAIILNVSGTLTDAQFVPLTFYPFMRYNVGQFLKDTFEERSTKQMIERLRETQNVIIHQEKQFKKKTKDLRQLTPHSIIPGSSVVGKKKKTVIEPDMNEVIANTEWFVEHLYKNYDQCQQLIELQLLMWVWAAKNKLFSVQFYGEVANCLHVWKYEDRIKIYSFTSGRQTSFFNSFFTI